MAGYSILSPASVLAIRWILNNSPGSLHLNCTGLFRHSEGTWSRSISLLSFESAQSIKCGSADVGCLLCIIIVRYGLSAHAFPKGTMTQIFCRLFGAKYYIHIALSPDILFVPYQTGLDCHLNVPICR